jgi:pimeloyl-ACP methyl ester carboxylesterase/DNA-binding winged helix-turn-helix (wHTH) protein
LSDHFLTMAEPPDALHCHRFLDCELDLARRELRRAGHLEKIEPKVFDLLAYLVQHRDRVVSKDELQDRIWPGVVVTEASLDRSVMKARRVVGDDARRQAVIRTVPRRGYRFVARLADDARRPFDPLRIEPEGLSPVHFAQSGEVHVAWRTLGEGPPDLLIAPGFVSHLDMRYRVRPVANFDARLARSARVIVFDKRGVGLSDRVSRPPTLDQMVDDMLAVLDAAGAKRAVVFGVSESGPAAALLAARHPERVAGLILYGSFAKGSHSDDYPFPPPDDIYRRWLDDVVESWGGPTTIELFAPGVAGDEEFREGWARYLRAAAAPAGVRAILEALLGIDVRAELPRIRAPALVLHRRGDRAIRFGSGEDLARRIPGARLRALEGDAHLWFVGDADSILEEIEGFLGQISGND